jgi:hypothetical protein
VRVAELLVFQGELVDGADQGRETIAALRECIRSLDGDDGFPVGCAVRGSRLEPGPGAG